MVKTSDRQATATVTPLYRHLLGDDVTGVHEDVVALHCGPGDVAATGRLHVQRGTSFAGRLTGALLRLPPAGRDVPTSLWISRRPDGERWVRVFGGRRPVRSRQRAGTAGTLIEQLGPMRLTFHLDVAAGALRFRQEDCHLVVAGVRVRVPSVLAPRVDAVARPTRDGGVAVAVRIASPLTGLLIAYAGVVDLAGDRG